MKITIENETLTAATQWALRAIPAHPPRPVLAGMLIDAADAELTLSGYDYYRSARATEPCDVAEPGKALVSGRVLTDLVRALPKTRHTTLALEGTDLTLSCGHAHITLPTLPLEDYPTLPTVEGASGTVNGAALAEASARVAAAASTDDTITVLTGVECTLDDDQLVLSATDRYAFHVAHVPWKPNPKAAKGKGKDQPLTEGKVLVPADVVRDAARILADIETAEITFTRHQFAVSVPGRAATGSILDGQLPDYAALFPNQFDTVVTADTEQLTTAIKHITPLLGKTDPMVLDISDGQITVRASTDDSGRGRDQVDALLEGTPLTLAFNPGLLLKTLQQIDGATTQLNFISPTKPALFHAPDQVESFQGLLMPIRLTPATPKND